MITIGKIRSVLYGAARLLGDAQAVKRSVRTKSAAPIAKRVGRRAAGKIAGRIIGGLFK